jgi:glucans biosynthesis protein
MVGVVPAPAAAHGRMGFDGVAEIARKLAAEPFRAPQPIPDFLTSISYDDYRDIRFDTKQSFWRDGGNFQIQLIHPGLYYGHAVKINTLESAADGHCRFRRNCSLTDETNSPIKFPTI